MAMMQLPVNYPYHQPGQGNPPPNAYRPPQQPSGGNSLMDLFKQYNPFSLGVRGGEAIGDLIGPAVSWYGQNTKRYMDKKGINVFGFPQSQGDMTPPPMIDGGDIPHGAQETFPTTRRPGPNPYTTDFPQYELPTDAAWPTDIPRDNAGFDEWVRQDQGQGMVPMQGDPLDGIRVDLPTPTPDQIGGFNAQGGGNVPTSGQIGNIPISPYAPELRNDVPPLLNANIEGLPGLSRQYESGDVTTPGLVGGTSGQLGGALDEGGYSRDALTNAIPDPIGTQYAQLQGRDEPMNVGLQSNVWDRPGVQARKVQGMHDEIGQAFPDFNQEEQLIATRIVNSSRYATHDMTDRQKRKYIQDLHPTDKAILAEYGRWISGEGNPSQTVPNVPMPGPTLPSGGSGMPAGGSGVMQGSFSPTNMGPPVLPPNTI